MCAAGALDALERELGALAAESPAAARAASAALRSALELLARHPLIGRRLEGGLRELAVSYGPSGLTALYRFRVPADEVRVLALARQRALGPPR